MPGRARRRWPTVAIPAGEALLGSTHPLAYPEDGEGPVRRVRLDAFAIAPHAVTNAEFARFVEATGYVTEAERFGWSFVFAGSCPTTSRRRAASSTAPWWRQVYGALVEPPRGAALDRSRGASAHPVVHVSWNDAVAYCAWAGARLPSEAEWEYAARGGRRGRALPVGGRARAGRRAPHERLAGRLPRRATRCDDGFLGTCPVDSFAPNGFGLYNTTGNVWEWCADWFSRDFHTRDTRTNPAGPRRGTHRTARGGSYLCHASYCRRYRVAARNALTPDSSSGNVGFRCVARP